MNEITTEEAAYIAGFIDGEGTISVLGKPDSIRAVVSIGNTNEEILQWIKDVTGMGSIVTFRYKNPKHKNRFVWSVGWNEGVDLVKALRPYLKIKADQADLFLQFPMPAGRRPTKGEKSLRLEIRDKVQKLNFRGRVAA